ncbi:M20/M25/M40 family metallo-hydrolase [bacterium]|nr:M20/M25/M40 family metallo-hydrolase [bacterium]
MGYAPKRQPVDLWADLSSCNVIASRVGNQHLMIVGAHLDSVAGTPGANDNASGVAVLLELARHLIRHQPAVTVRLVAFCGEEGEYRNGHSVAGTGRRGSAAYVQSLSQDERRRLMAMINIDMVGAGPPKLDVGDMTASGEAPALCCLQLAHELHVPAAFDQFGGKSDYRPFHDAGLPFVAVAWGDDPSHHTPADSVSLVDPGKLDQTLRVVATYVGDAERLRSEGLF